MDFDELSTRSFQVTNSLESGCRTRLATVCQRLDFPAARASLSPEEYRKVDDTRRQALSAALASTWELVEESHFDIQVLTVLMRLLVEVEGLSGIERSLRLIDRMIADGWVDRKTELALFESTDRERVLRQWSRYLDSVFEQIDAYIARESDLHGDALAAELREWGTNFVEASELVEATLTRVNWRSTWWPRLHRRLQELLDNASRTVPHVPSPADVVGAIQGATQSNEEPTHPSHETDQSRESAVAEPTFDPAIADVSAVTLPVSERFWVLQRSLGALETLLKRGEYEKARVIVRDLEEILGAFDVASYFPGLFGTFFELSARYSEGLAAHYERSPQREAALSRLYRSDLGRFLSLPLGEDS